MAEIKIVLLQNPREVSRNHEKENLKGGFVYQTNDIRLRWLTLGPKSILFPTYIHPSINDLDLRL